MAYIPAILQRYQYHQKDSGFARLARSAGIPSTELTSSLLVSSVNTPSRHSEVSAPRLEQSPGYLERSASQFLCKHRHLDFTHN